MACRVALLLLACAGAAALRVDVTKETGITRVVNLLKDMQATLEKEADQDQELYDKLQCWCETNEKENTKALDTSTALRAKENAQWNQDEKDAISAIGNLK